MAKNNKAEEANTQDEKQHTIQQTDKEKEALKGHRTGDYDVNPVPPQQQIDEHWQKVEAEQKK